MTQLISIPPLHDSHQTIYLVRRNSTNTVPLPWYPSLVYSIHLKETWLCHPSSALPWYTPAWKIRKDTSITLYLFKHSYDHMSSPCVDILHCAIKFRMINASRLIGLYTLNTLETKTHRYPTSACHVPIARSSWPVHTINAPFPAQGTGKSNEYSSQLSRPNTTCPTNGVDVTYSPSPQTP